MSVLQQIIDYFRDLLILRLPFLPENIRDSVFIIIFCIIAFFELYLFIFLRRLKQAYVRRRNKKWEENIGNMLANIIVFGDEEDSETIINHFLPRFRKLPLKREYVRQILSRELLSYHANFMGKSADVLRELYVRLGLERYASKKIRSSYWEQQIEGMREVTQMWIRSEADAILAYTDDENAQLRMEAQAAYVKLSTENSFRFLDRARERILDWHQLVLFEVITKTKNVKIPSFAQWMGSPNDTVVMLCLKLANHYQQLETLPEMQRLLEHPNQKIRQKTVQVIGNFEAQMLEEDLVARYPLEDFEIRMEILRSLGKIGSGDQLEFLQERLSEEDFRLRMQAMRAIKMHGENGKSRLHDLSRQVEGQNLEIIAHVLDERIKA